YRCNSCIEGIHWTWHNSKDDVGEIPDHVRSGRIVPSINAHGKTRLSHREIGYWEGTEGEVELALAWIEAQEISQDSSNKKRVSRRRLLTRKRDFESRIVGPRWSRR